MTAGRSMPSLRELEGWMTTAQAAQAAGRSRQGVINLGKDGRVRAVQVGQAYDTGRSVWIFDPESVKEFAVKEQERGRGGHRALAVLTSSSTVALVTPAGGTLQRSSATVQEPSETRDAPAYTRLATRSESPSAGLREDLEGIPMYSGAGVPGNGP